MLTDPTELRGRDALAAGLDALAQGAARRAPKLSGSLARSVQTVVLTDELGIVYFPRKYARKQELREWQKHPHGGQAHYLRDTVDLDVQDVTDAMARVLFGD